MYLLVLIEVSVLGVIIMMPSQVSGLISCNLSNTYLAGKKQRQDRIALLGKRHM